MLKSMNIYKPLSVLHVVYTFKMILFYSTEVVVDSGGNCARKHVGISCKGNQTKKTKKKKQTNILKYCEKQFRYG